MQQTKTNWYAIQKPPLILTWGVKNWDFTESMKKCCILDLSDHRLAPQIHFLELSVCQPCCLLLQLAGSLFETMSPAASVQHWQMPACSDWRDPSSVKHVPSRWGSPSSAWCARCCSCDCCNKRTTMLQIYWAENVHEQSEQSLYGTSGGMSAWEFKMRKTPSKTRFNFLFTVKPNIAVLSTLKSVDLLDSSLENCTFHYSKSVVQ